MSARAAWRLETLGFSAVVRYPGGKEDWLVSRLPVAGREASAPRAFELARADVPSCTLDESVREVAVRVREEGWPLAVVVNEERVVLGRVRPRDLAEAPPEAVARELMVDGPRTIRGAMPAAEMGAWLDRRKVPGVIVTTADGVLVGYLRRADLP